MASRYWIGGSGTWDSSDTSHWSATSGGAGGESVPTTSDDVFFDANSTGTVTISSSVQCRHLDCTGFTGTISHTSGTLSCAGNFTLVPGMTYSPVGAITFSTTGVSSRTINTAGKTLAAVTFNANATWVLQSALTCSGAVSLTGSSNATLDLNDFNLTSTTFTANASTTLLARSGTITVTSFGTCFNLIASSTIDAGTCTVVIANTGGTGKIVNVNGKTMHNLVINAGGGGVVSLSNGTWNNFTVLTPKSVRISSGSTLTITGTVTMTGSSGSTISLDSSTNGSPANISKASGTVSCDWLELEDINATGGADWYAGSNSTDLGGNSGWLFAAAPIIQAFSAVMSTLTATLPKLTQQIQGAAMASLIGGTSKQTIKVLNAVKNTWQAYVDLGKHFVLALVAVMATKSASVSRAIAKSLNAAAQQKSASITKGAGKLLTAVKAEHVASRSVSVSKALTAAKAPMSAQVNKRISKVINQSLTLTVAFVKQVIGEAIRGLIAVFSRKPQPTATIVKKAAPTATITKV